MKNFTNLNSYGEIKSRDTNENREQLELSGRAFTVVSKCYKKQLQTLLSQILKYQQDNVIKKKHIDIYIPILCAL